MSKFSRLSFLKTAGLATGAAMIGGVPAAAAAADDIPHLVAKPSPLPREPLLAYVRDIEKGEVTIVSGLRETTFRDHGLVKRIKKASHPKPPTKGREAI